MRNLFVLAVISAFLMSCEKETEEVLPENRIPSEITAYISTHFPGSQILHAIKDEERNEVSYEITLNEGFYLEFNKNLDVTDIEGTSKLPDSVIPSAILEHVASNYSGNFITGWELDDRHQQVRLNNLLELEYAMNGEFLRVDY